MIDACFPIDTLEPNMIGIKEMIGHLEESKTGIVQGMSTYILEVFDSVGVNLLSGMVHGGCVPRINDEIHTEDGTIAKVDRVVHRVHTNREKLMNFTLPHVRARIVYQIRDNEE